MRNNVDRRWPPRERKQEKELVPRSLDLKAEPWIPPACSVNGLSNPELHSCHRPAGEAESWARGRLANGQKLSPRPRRRRCRRREVTVAMLPACPGYALPEVSHYHYHAYKPDGGPTDPSTDLPTNWPPPHFTQNYIFHPNCRAIGMQIEVNFLHDRSPFNCIWLRPYRFRFRVCFAFILWGWVVGLVGWSRVQGVNGVAGQWSTWLVTRPRGRRRQIGWTTPAPGRQGGRI